MNTINELTQHGIDVKTAESMIDGYKRRIGTRNGIYIIADITFDFTEHGRDVELKCSDCGRVIHRMMIKGRNKWSELIKSCPCQKENKAIEKKEEHEKFLKKKKDEMKIRVGETHGDYMITSLDENLEECFTPCAAMNANQKFRFRKIYFLYERIFIAQTITVLLNMAMNMLVRKGIT